MWRTERNLFVLERDYVYEKREMSPGSDERSRVEAAQQDPSRFADLYEEHFYRVYAYVARRVGDRHQAEDLTSEVFREALAGIAKFEWRGAPFVSWLLGIAAHRVADHLKRLGRERQQEVKEPSESAEVERSAMLFQLVDRLPEAQFRVIHSRFVEQKSIREIAEEMGRSEGAVKQLQLRALENLRAQMEADHA